MRLRKAIDADIPYFVEFRKILLDKEYDNSIDITLTDYFRNSLNDRSLIAWVAEDNNQVISTVCLSICNLVPRFDNPSGKIAYLTNVYTIPGYRKQGVATNLTQEAINEAKSLGIKKILLNSSHMAKSIYEKLGFSNGKNYFELIM